MRKKGIRRWFPAVFLMSFCLLLVQTAPVEAGEKEQEDIRLIRNSVKQMLELSNIRDVAERTAMLAATSRRERISASEIRFFNKVEGYSLVVPAEARAEMALAGVQAVLEWDNIRLEIYREDMSTRQEFQEYVRQSSQFTQNRTDHIIERERNFQIGEREACLLSWNRRMLEKVVEDKNHYTAIDLFAEGEAAFTLLFKSAAPIDENTCLAVAASLRLEETSGRADIRMTASFHEERWNAETKAAFEAYFGRESKLSWGIFDPFAPASMDSLLRMEQELSYEFSILMSYNNVKDNHNLLPLRKELEHAREYGRLLLLSMQTTVQPGERGNMAYRLLEGEYDGFLRAFAIEIKLAEAPVLLRLESGMNDNSQGYSSGAVGRDAGLYKAMYQYVYDFFTKEGVQEYLIWVWSPGERSLPDYKWNHEVLYYPGDACVDVVGLTGYNTGEPWRSFQEIYGPSYKRAAAAYGKPLMISEFASASEGGDKAQWMAEMFGQIAEYPDIKAAVWWNHCEYGVSGEPDKSYWLDETEELKKLFGEKVKETTN